MFQELSFLPIIDTEIFYQFMETFVKFFPFNILSAFLELALENFCHCFTVEVIVTLLAFIPTSCTLSGYLPIDPVGPRGTKDA